ncbi:MAG TPA: methyltransferase domain-containing protein [Miltoncostaea sp.]|nr:methyltransferase domain-containing protein [Miltoncostaea sp.]
MDDAARRFTAFEAAGWSERARSYGDLSERITARVADALLDAGGVASRTRVLDVGCGPGVVVAAALARGARPTGVDVAAGMLAEARRRHPGVELVEADVVALPFGDAIFDAAVGNFVLNHLPEPERAVAELRRVLAPGGRVALSLWGPPERTRWLGLVTEALADEGVPMPAVVDEGPPSDRFADPARMRALLEGAGLRGASVETLAFEVTVPDADALWDGVLGGSVRTSAAILARPPEEQGRARAALARLAEAYRGPGGLVLPVEVVIGSARRAQHDVVDVERGEGDG